MNAQVSKRISFTCKMLKVNNQDVFGQIVSAIQNTSFEAKTKYIRHNARPVVFLC